MPSYRMKRRHDYGGATYKQRDYIAALALKLAPDDSIEARKKVVLDHGAPEDLRSITKFQASLLIDSLLRDIPNVGRPVNDCPDPGELAADRWNEQYG